ncbi:MAG TPA: hydrogenase maturation protease [Pyrinomonadaceae bacterium]|nr:hydrogenase maturation protease [Pyrinomonadaceae bacterium]
MSDASILIAGIGNIFLGDDAFGCEVIKELSRRDWPDNVRLVDFGIRGFDLAYALLDEHELTIFVDATPRGNAPGTVYTIEPDLTELESFGGGVMLETHGMDPMKVLQMVKSMGGQFKKILLVGCEPETFGPEEGLLGLSEVVQQAVPEAARIVEGLVNKHLKQSLQMIS